MYKSKIDEIIQFLKDKTPLITTHHLADIDALASTHVFKFFLNQIWPNKKVFLTYSKFTKATKNFISKFNQKYPKIDLYGDEEFDLSQIDVLIILDSNNLDQIVINGVDDLRKLEFPIIFIDHHLNLNPNSSLLNLIDDTRHSTLEIIHEFFTQNSLELSTPYIFLLIAGILTDTSFFKYSDNDSIKLISTLLTPQIKFQEVKKLLKFDKDISEKIADIKGLQRVKLIRVKDWLIGITQVSNFRASVASTLLNVGFDVSIVYSRDKTGIKITTRAKNDVCQKSRLHLGKILNGLHQGTGGGHNGAASVHIKDETDVILDELINEIKQTLINDLSL
ncbi:MAG: DHH family phosphoesterase [Candidatus Lokiarchaeota archaeon]|nr:DHH family phosphoesterase [Candidatus Lokiarchaeota archaeon]